MTSKAFGLAQLGNAYSDGALSNRNKIINGAMQVAQRGTSITGIGGISTYTLDRWYMAREAGVQSARFTVTQEALSGSDAPRITDGLSTTMKIDVTTASADQTSFATSGYTPNSLDVRLNGETRDSASITVSTDRTFRGAWQFSGDVIEIDMVKAREIHRDNLRSERAPRLQQLDTEWFRAAETADTVRQAEIAAAKQALRDVTADARIESASTPEELKLLTLDTLLTPAV